MGPGTAGKPSTTKDDGHSTEPVAPVTPELKALEEENRRLKEVVSVRQGKEPTRCGYLFKYRPYSTSLFSNTWELRFFSLNGSVLQYYKTERDTTYHPRGLVKVKGCIVEVEGRKRDKYWTFSVIDQSGLSLLRMSTQNEKDAESWVQALVGAGCTKRTVNNAFRVRSPLKSVDVRWKGDESQGLRRSPSGTTSLSHRWEEPTADAAVAGMETMDSHADRLLERDAKRGPKSQKDYTSDSMSEVGQTLRPTRPTTRRHGDMRPSSELYTESRPSVLSADRIAFTQHSGILNLMTLVLLATNARLILENLLKYGVLTSPARWVYFLYPNNNMALFLCYPALALFALFGVAIEKLGVARLEAEKKASVAKRKKDTPPAEARRIASRMGARTEAILWTLNALNTTAVLVLPSAVVHLTTAQFVPAFVVVILTIVQWMKMVSYAHCNQDLRRMKRERDIPTSGKHAGSQGTHGGPDPPAPKTVSHAQETIMAQQVQYPDNVTLGNFAYFLVAPTLVYQTSYPQSNRRRSRWILWYFIRLMALIGVLLIITEQYMQPTIANSVIALAQMRWMQMFERVLKLSIPTLYGWIFIFYTLFHVWLNIVAELTGFGDREFYKDWWNATTIGDYWRLWNVPVHKWLLRHVYYPAIRHKVPKTVAACLVFGVSAVFHEMLIGLPLHMVRGWAFFGVMSQVPLLFLTDYIKKKAKSDQIGNFIFWFTFCIFGQPMAIMLYYHDWVIVNRPEWYQAQREAKI